MYGDMDRTEEEFNAGEEDKSLWELVVQKERKDPKERLTLYGGVNVFGKRAYENKGRKNSKQGKIRKCDFVSRYYRETAGPDI